MSGLVRAFRTLPIAMKALVVALVVALIAGVLLFFPDTVQLIVAAGLIVVAVCLVGYNLVLRAFDGSRAGPFIRRLGENAGLAGSLRDPSARARLDDLRRRFESGLETFKDHGKDVYAMPWYLLVGEPGGGKTEAVRHSNVGFPPGLQDQLQGSGGTMNMNWWFTNQAVILDTAGRMMFEEAIAGQTSEWREFLKLLRTARPNCPVNGLLLVIPADSLITDSPEEIDRKASVISEQLEVIQKLLGVRFPVFVIITKSDLINGFREFFDDLTDPSLQHQILGWSNPNTLDTPFDPSEVTRHLETVRERLGRRRMGQLVDPVHTEDPRARRTDEVDALFGFPDAIMSITPRLRRYLERVFVAGEWSAKPLFLRGIYFTSSMREGEALDADLAAALGVKMDALPEGKIWERDRAYFLRDLFVDKIFREKGLVTRADNTSALKRQRQAAVLIAATVVLGTIGALTWIGNRQLTQSILEPQAFWAGVEQIVEEGANRPERFGIFYRDPTTGTVDYGGSQTVELDLGDEITQPTRAQLQQMAVEEAEREYAPPAVFGPIAAAFGDPFEGRDDAQRAIFEMAVLGPAVRLAREDLAATDASAWDADASAALIALARLESGRSAAEDGEGRGVDLSAVARFLLRDEEKRAAFEADGERLDAAARLAFASYGDEEWPPAATGAGTREAERALIAGVERFITAKQSLLESGGSLVGDLRELVAALRDFERRETELTADAGSLSVNTVAGYEGAALSYAARLDALRPAAERVDRRLASLGDSARLDPEALIEEAREAVLRVSMAEYDALVAALDGVESERLGDVRLRAESTRDQLRVSLERDIRDLVQTLGGLRDRHLTETASGEPAYAARMRAYEVAGERLAADAVAAAPAGLAGALEAIDGAERVALVEIARAGVGGEASAARRVAEDAVRLGSARLRRVAVESALTALLAGGGPEGFVRTRAVELGAVERPSLPLSSMDGGAFDPAYHPGGAAELFRATEAVRGAIGDGAGDRRVLDAEGLRSRSGALLGRLGSYSLQYSAYWSETVPAMAEARDGLGWMGFRDGLDALDGATLSATLLALNELTAEALRALPDERLAEDQRALLVLSASPTESAAVRALATGGGRTAIDEWRLLGITPADARERVLELTADGFASSLMRPYSPEARGPAARYLSSLVVRGLEALAVSSEGRAREALDRLGAVGRGFPLCVDAPALSVENFDESIGLIETVQGFLPRTGGGVGRIVDGSVVGLPTRIQDLLRRLRGDFLFDTTRGRAWFEKLSRLGSALSEADATWELSLIGYQRQDTTEAADRFPYIEAVWNGQALPLAGGRTRVGSDMVIPNAGVRITIPASGDLEIRLSSTAGGPIEAVGVVEAPWGGLRSMVGAGARRLTPSTDPTLPRELDGAWVLGLILNDATGRPLRGSNGRPLRFWIGVNVTGELPDVGQWPTLAEWP